MKTRLTKEQSQHLIDLGVPKELASETVKVFDEDDTLSYTCPIFKLEDFLNGEILPKEIEKHNKKWRLFMSFIPAIDDVSEEWIVGYKGYPLTHKGLSNEEYQEILDSEFKFELAKELIDALYQLACWYYGEYLKSKSNT